MTMKPASTLVPITCGCVAGSARTLCINASGPACGGACPMGLACRTGIEFECGCE